MRRLQQRFGRLADLVKVRRKAAVMTPDKLRLAWALFQETGELPEDEHQREFVERLVQAGKELDGLHQVVPPAE